MWILMYEFPCHIAFDFLLLLCRKEGVALPVGVCISSRGGRRWLCLSGVRHLVLVSGVIGF
ncbi:hypothetical protein RchiOBHm_Chr2g0146071 [Rosa chinensis]|uniref:Uncharacterized protein n=1 Tax=Rosa chinensis TaxID=74649 RepID=A0A2P6RYT3_ROSCH|nr:hypothetical protein RchiOBHm_Chr2g0146071 [Rosa chinensis]